MMYKIKMLKNHDDHKKGTLLTIADYALPWYVEDCKILEHYKMKVIGKTACKECGHMKTKWRRINLNTPSQTKR